MRQHSVRQGATYEGRRVSRSEYLSLPDDGFKYDMIDGVPHVAPSHSADHAQYQVSFAVKLRFYLKKHPRGRVFTELDVFLRDGGDVVRPDVCFVLSENLDIIATHIHGTPDLVCELLSDSTESSDLSIMAERYLACGVREYWIVDPRTYSIQLWRNDGRVRWRKESAEILQSDFLPGLRLTRELIFQ